MALRNNINSADTQPVHAKDLLDWYRQNARSMPWRVPPDDHAMGVRTNPYHVWLSEVMLQQTQVATVREYFIRFINRWPNVYTLAEADEEDILKEWAGLGYYSRARNLKKCADIVAESHNGRFPDTAAKLKKLPGIGDYTSASIAAIAFDEPIAVIDGNVERVMARLFRIEIPFPDAKAETRQLLETILDPKLPGEFAQAMMDLGATICTAKRPSCKICPLQDHCEARANGDILDFPRKSLKKSKPTRKGAAFILERPDGAILLQKRGDKGMLAGMSQIPTTNWNSRQDGETGKSAAPVSAEWKNMGTVRHTFTHFHLELEVWYAHVENATKHDGWWSSRKDIDGEALPTLMRKVIALGLNQCLK